MSTELEIYKKNPEELYSKDFFRRMQRIRKWQFPVGERVADLYKIKSVVDFGCASGYYLEGFKKAGATVKGFEYLLENSLEFVSKDMEPFIEEGNVMEPIDCGTFDLSMSIEVAEHLLPEKSDIFINNLVKASNKYILFTAAPPGQGGTGHINEQPAKFWIDKFAAKGFVLSSEDVSKVQDLFKGLPFYNKYTRLIKRQIMFFVKE